MSWKRSIPSCGRGLIELMGGDFDFAALTEVDDTVREEILDELPAATVAEGVREMDSDDTVYILEDLPKEEQAEILQQLPAPELRGYRGRRQERVFRAQRPGGKTASSSRSNRFTRASP
jgi:Mg/Co/Ni transporter MgtE